MTNLKRIFEKHEHGHLTDEITDLEEGYDVLIHVIDRNTFNLMNELNETGEYTVYEDEVNDTITITQN
ncbi:hypothetical protein ACL72_10135 [Listeria monocytogenes]|uniref:Bacillus phage SPbeta YonK domain-containing protein n=1 Tax=Listeria immobilis TaxID=2713502 RepID=A0ABR6SYJ3_9LIST|nr:hypothetical protein [Listeria immobilis]EAC4628512.1 hypothetical protein [Listeria monocytogenes]EAC6356365.1 hypothetical protein [Listeria monocytogenes]EAC7062894.1 hypothetical protein [Listeria monocytogenes]EAD7040797.1 hypothetical protein [Listeria monocytogenes]MBC1507384.1 hypothetical protein [Listeria immobilis]